MADDIWFWAMAVLNGTKIKLPAKAQPKLIYVDIDTQVNGETLWAENKTKNDVQLRQVIEHYPELLEKLIRESAEAEPYISVIVPIKNPANLSACIENIFWQKFPDFELIIINLGARVKLPTLPTNFRVINYPGGSLADALNLGLRKASGDYVMFKDENSIFPREALDNIAQAAQTSADVIHFAGHIQLAGNEGKFILDDAPELTNKAPTLFNAAKQLRAVMWLQNKFSKRLDTKIFRREFLTNHKIFFGKDISEFAFQALIHAEKYLLVPQAFCYCKD